MMIHIPIIINYHKLSWAINPGLFGKAGKAQMPTGQGVFPQDLQLDSSALQSILQQHAPGEIHGFP